ncbi:adenosine monophosphate-protein transferase SoFic [bacterium BMS3Abin15]|nr:adenosine monophosphate-protein transferase SoFic [bacterium BMS3Abin15]HDZ85869.1 Fic family protein [Candidatus Moranbacteria bacterium]
MFKPKYVISSRLLANIKRITEIITNLNNQSFSGVVLAELEKRAREISAFSSTSIEGNPLPLTDVKRILKIRPEHIRDSEKEVLNYNKALIELNDLIRHKKQVFDLPLILKIQKTIIQGLIEDYRSGCLRREPVFVNNPRTRQAIYLPPEQSEVSKLMDDLFDYIKKNENVIDPLILAGIFHKQFVIIHPFIDGNGRTSRLATKVLLAKTGLNTFNLFSFENYYNKNVSKYFQEVGLVGNYYEIKDKIDFTSWLEYFTDGIIDELLRVGKELEHENISPEKELKDYHKKIIDYIEKHGYISDRDYAKLTKRAKPTRNLDFRKLIELDIIEKLGKGKATYYKLKNK